MSQDRLKVKFADECPDCECCGEPFCTDCMEHYADCDCIGPHQEGYIVDEEGYAIPDPDAGIVDYE